MQHDWFEFLNIYDIDSAVAPMVDWLQYVVNSEEQNFDMYSPRNDFTTNETFDDTDDTDTRFYSSRRGRSNLSDFKTEGDQKGAGFSKYSKDFEDEDYSRDRRGSGW